MKREQPKIVFWFFSNTVVKIEIKHKNGDPYENC